MANTINTIPKEKKFLRFLKTPFKILARAHDFYVQSLSSCSGGHVAYGAYGMGCPMQSVNLPRSVSANDVLYSNNTRDEDLRELMRVASTRSIAGKTEAEILKRSTSEGGKHRRSRSLAIGRIDEDKPCDKFDEVEVCPRSKSYVMWRKK